MKFVTDFGPLLIFFYFYKTSDNSLSIAIPPLIISTIIAVIIVYAVEKKVPYVPLLGAALISLFGGLTLYFNNPIFIYLKPTIINLIFATALLISDTILKKNLTDEEKQVLREIMGNLVIFLIVDFLKKIRKKILARISLKKYIDIIFLDFQGLSKIS